jgi:hypothetical protein
VPPKKIFTGLLSLISWRHLKHWRFSIMTQKQIAGFSLVQKMVRDHLLDAAKHFTGPTGDNPGPAPAQCYATAYSTATGAYAGGGINVSEWAGLHAEIREHSVAESAK